MKEAASEYCGTNGKLEQITSDPQYAGIERVMPVLAPLPDGAKLQFMPSRRGSLGGQSVQEALRPGS